MGTGTVSDAVVERVKARIAEYVRVDALIWFGSRSRGAAVDEWSDYDFLVVSRDFEGIPPVERGRPLFPLQERGASYDFLCYTPEEYERLKSRATMIREVSRTGVQLI